MWAQISAIQPEAENYWKRQLLPTLYLTCTEFAPKAAENNWGKYFHLAQSLSEKTSILKPLSEYSQIKIETYILKKGFLDILKIERKWTGFLLVTD